MTDTPPKPKSRRWRWLVLGAALVVGLVGWWNWPRVDGRFLGTWEVYSNGRKTTGVNTFYGDGSGVAVDVKTGSRVRFQWNAKDDVFSSPPDTTGLRLVDVVQAWIKRVTHPQLVGYKVLSISENEIQMWTRNPRNQQSLVTFRRVVQRPGE